MIYTHICNHRRHRRRRHSGCGRLCTTYTSPSTTPPSMSCGAPYAVSNATPTSFNFAPSAARAPASTLSACRE
eukprot:30954-Pelagococcus_subviridis.AAC.4